VIPSTRAVRVVVFDSGGGSTQFTFGAGGDISERFSLDIGAVRVTERYGLANAVSEPVLADAFDAITEQFERLDAARNPDAVVGMGGTVTNLAAVAHGLAEYDPERIHGTVIDTGELDRQIERYRTRDADARREIVGLQPKRADVILGGACIVRAILTKLGVDALIVSDRGVRHGVFADRFG
jgi:exopolyphosphatase/guanosine-5'-triphosphate,3'-diphosphate pyrophosphatase